MTKYIIFALFLLGIHVPSISPHRVPFYRTDYTYIDNFDAFYKIHILDGSDISTSAWSTAFYACADEEATLFYPNAEGEWSIVKNLTKAIKEGTNMTEVLVGFHDEYKLGEFITVDGRSMPKLLDSNSNLHPNLLSYKRSLHPRNAGCISMDIDTGLLEWNNCLRTSDTTLMFVCKKVDDESCPTIDRDYKYIKALRKCYKIHTKPQLWQDAMKTCFIEGGILAVIENEAQAEEVKYMLDQEVSYFVGVRKIISYHNGYSEIYYTVKGKKFSDMYQSQEQLSKRDYGTVVNRNSYLYTETAVDTDKLAFICEMEVS